MGVAGSLCYKDKTEDWTREHSAKSKSMMPFSKQVINQSIHPRSRNFWHFGPTQLLEGYSQGLTLQTREQRILVCGIWEAQEEYMLYMKKMKIYMMKNILYMGIWVSLTKGPNQITLQCKSQTTSSTHTLGVGNQILSYHTETWTHHHSFQSTRENLD